MMMLQQVVLGLSVVLALGVPALAQSSCANALDLDFQGAPPSASGSEWADVSGVSGRAQTLGTRGAWFRIVNLADVSNYAQFNATVAGGSGKQWKMSLFAGECGGIHDLLQVAVAAYEEELHAALYGDTFYHLLLTVPSATYEFSYTVSTKDVIPVPSVSGQALGTYWSAYGTQDFLTNYDPKWVYGKPSVAPWTPNALDIQAKGQMFYKTVYVSSGQLASFSAQIEKGGLDSEVFVFAAASTHYPAGFLYAHAGPSAAPSASYVVRAGLESVVVFVQMSNQLLPYTSKHLKYVTTQDEVVSSPKTCADYESISVTSNPEMRWVDSSQALAAAPQTCGTVPTQGYWLRFACPYDYDDSMWYMFDIGVNNGTDPEALTGWSIIPTRTAVFSGSTSALSCEIQGSTERQISFLCPYGTPSKVFYFMVGSSTTESGLLKTSVVFLKDGGKRPASTYEPPTHGMSSLAIILLSTLLPIGIIGLVFFILLVVFLTTSTSTVLAALNSTFLAPLGLGCKRFKKKGSTYSETGVVSLGAGGVGGGLNEELIAASDDEEDDEAPPEPEKTAQELEEEQAYGLGGAAAAKPVSAVPWSPAQDGVSSYVSMDTMGAGVGAGYGAPPLQQPSVAPSAPQFPSYVPPADAPGWGPS